MNTGPDSLSSPGKRRIVVLGGGFSGVYTAKYLEKKLRRDPDFEVVLINHENYFVFQPLLAEVVSGNIGVLDTVSPLRRLLRDSTIYVREIDGVDLEQKTVTLSPGFRPRALVLPYEQLVIALGSVTDFRGMTGLYEHALPFKNLADAIRLRNHVIRILEEAVNEPEAEYRRQMLTFVVAGGGFSGVEVAAEINDFVRRTVRQYRHLDPSEIRVVLVHSGQRVLERELAQKLSAYAGKILEKRGVELLLGNRLKTATPGAAILSDGTRIETKTLVSTVPSTANPLVESMPLPKQRGKIEVDGHLQVKGFSDVWAVGDCALVPNADGQGFSPPTAQHATRQAKLLANNICATLDKKPLKTFDFPGLGKMGSLGHHRAVAELFNRIHISGFLAWVMWRTVYWWKLPGLDRKIKVGADWMLDLLIPPDSVQLNLGQGAGIAQAHYEPGEVIFSEGDLGDSLYIIIEGEADVVRERDGEEQLLATLGPGDYFGELALLNERTRTATVRCKSSLVVLTMRKAEFTTLAANLPDLRNSFESVMQKRLAADAEEQAGA